MKNPHCWAPPGQALLEPEWSGPILQVGYQGSDRQQAGRCDAEDLRVHKIGTVGAAESALQGSGGPEVLLPPGGQQSPRIRVKEPPPTPSPLLRREALEDLEAQDSAVKLAGLSAGPGHYFPF